MDGCEPLGVAALLPFGPATLGGPDPFGLLPDLLPPMVPGSGSSAAAAEGAEKTQKENGQRHDHHGSRVVVVVAVNGNVAVNVAVAGKVAGNVADHSRKGRVLVLVRGIGGCFRDIAEIGTFVAISIGPVAPGMNDLSFQLARALVFVLVLEERSASTDASASRGTPWFFHPAQRCSRF